MREGLRRLIVAATATLVVLPIGEAGAQTAPPASRETDPAHSATALANLSPDDLARLRSLPVDAGPSSRRPLTDAEGRVAVVVEGVDRAELGEAVEDAGGLVASNVPSGVSAYVAPEDLAEVTGRPGVTGAWVDQAPIPMDVSEGVGVRGLPYFGATNAEVWHDDLGEHGEGQSIGIIDVGFNGFNALPIPADRPPAGQIVAPLNLCTPPDMFGPAVDDHGTAVAEIVYDMAPAATLYLVCIDRESDLTQAANHLRDQGVKIVNMSLGFTDGRGDGSFHHVGQAAEVVRRTRLFNGMLWTVSAGNDAQRHYMVTAGDTEASPDSYVEIFPGRPFAGEQNEIFNFVVGANSTAFVDVRWDSWFGPIRDYDLLVTDTSAMTEPIVSVNDQTAGLPPWEGVTIQNESDDDVVYFAEIRRFSAPISAVRFDFFLDGAVALEAFHTAQSVTEPATSPFVVTVGAHCFDANEREPFSSMGPTPDGRIKPDISGPDAVVTQVFGEAEGGCDDDDTGFFGTSAAAPHTAGAAALLLGQNANLDVAELQAQLEAGAATSDVPPQGPDNGTGFGQLTLSDPPVVPAPPTGDFFSGVPPVRIMDTRSSAGVCMPGPCSRLGPGQTRTLQVHGIAGVPPEATAVALNVTAVSPTAASHVTVFPSGQLVPTVSNLNFSAGLVVANQVTVSIGLGGFVSVFNAAGSVDVVVDLVGYYSPAGAVGFVPLNPPGRIMDTRVASCVGPRCVAIGPGQTADVPVRGANAGGTAIPIEAQVVALNVTGVAPTSATHLTIWPEGDVVPTASSLNLSVGAVRANLVIATIGSNGTIRIRNAFGQANVVVDVLGWYQPGGDRYVALSPRRTLDTRSGNGRFGALTGGAQFDHQVRLIYRVPNDATAALLNVTVVAPAGPGHVTIFPDGAPQVPRTSNINFTAGQVVPNAVISAIGGFVPGEPSQPAGQITIFNNASSPATHVIADLAGYFISD
jgi:hypothetical protein